MERALRAVGAALEGERLRAAEELARAARGGRQAAGGHRVARDADGVPFYVKREAELRDARLALAQLGGMEQ
jgi:hypothetical protein